ncbi:MAG: hypothetical protein K6F28_10260, partial [Lachnospiraceae bacterium]|nr:hypothetical protein [Lachnospiraceae bacterium]
MKRYLAFILAAVLVFSAVPTDVAWGFELPEDGNTQPGAADTEYDKAVDTADEYADEHTDEYADENAVGNTDGNTDGYTDEYADGNEQAAEVEADRQSFDDATPISVNAEVTGSITDTTNGNYYQFTLSKPGHVDFTFSHKYI